MPPFRLTVRFAAALAAAIAFAFVLSSWLESRAERARLASTIAAQQQLIAAAASRERDRDAALKSTLDEIAALKRTVRTPQQIVSSLPDDLSLPQPITLVSSAPAQQGIAASRAPEQGSGASADSRKGTALSPANPGVLAPTEAPAADLPESAAESALSLLKSEIPNLKLPAPSPLPAASVPAQTSAPASCPPGSAVIPAADLKPLYDYVQNCLACQATLATAQADLQDAKARTAALTRERDAAVTAAKGGSFWRQLKRNGKWLAIGAAIGAAAAHHF